MAATTDGLKIKRTIDAAPEEVYRAFTNATRLREWFCDVATSEPRKGGRLYVAWNSGYYAAGEYTALTPGKRVVFTWMGRNEPGPTQVKVTITAARAGTVVTVDHTGQGRGKAWATAIAETKRGWEVGLENLQSVLETGQDLRLARRPMLGINVDEFNAEIAAKLGAPAPDGVRLGGAVEGMGAHAAGLQKDDVIVGIAGKKVLGYSTLADALQGRQAGDTVKVTYYRDGEKKTTDMTLSARPLPEVPATPAEFADAIRRIYAEGNKLLDACLDGVSEAEASHRPGPGEWSARDVIAHLIIDLRETQQYISDLIGSEERWTDGNAGNVPARITALTSVLKTLSEARAELKRAQDETVAMVAALPGEFVSRRGSYWRLGHGLLQSSTHTQEHAAQVQAAIDSARR